MLRPCYRVSRHPSAPPSPLLSSFTGPNGAFGYGKHHQLVPVSVEPGAGETPTPLPPCPDPPHAHCCSHPAPLSLSHPHPLSPSGLISSS